MSNSKSTGRLPCYASRMAPGMRRLRDYLSLIKPGIVASNALTALAGLALAALREGGGFPWRLGAILLAGTSLLVGGSCAVNNWMDRDLDARMERTKDRPTARGSMGAAEALGIGAGLMAAGLALLFAASAAAALVGLGGAFVYLAAYTAWSKRRGAASSYIGGIAGAFPPLIGWAAVDPRLGGPAWALFALLVVWQQAHVRALALRRAKDYRAAGIPMAGLSPRMAEDGSIVDVGSRATLLAWAAATLPLPTIAIVMGKLPMGVPSLTGLPLAAALGSCTLSLAWVLAGIAGFRSSSWPGRMFAASLAYLVLVFGALFAIGL
jgi:heme o synthase